MGKAFWPIAISVTALAGALTWRYMPEIKRRLPNDAGERIRNALDEARSRMKDVGEDLAGRLKRETFAPGNAAANARTRTQSPFKAAGTAPRSVADAAVDKVKESVCSFASVEKELDAMRYNMRPDKASCGEKPRTGSFAGKSHFGATLGGKPDDMALGGTRSGTASKKFSSMLDSKKRVQAEETPCDRGVVRATNTGGAKWCVLKHITPVYGLDGKTVGTVAGGRFFMIERTAKKDGELMFEGNFTPKRLPKTVRVAAKDVMALTGAPENLSENQRISLRMYYQYAGELEALKSKILARESKKNPYAVEAAEKLTKLRAMEADAKRIDKSDFDAGRKTTYELAALRNAVSDLNEKARKWKAAHASELAVPENDPAFQKIFDKLKQYSDAIQGLVP